MARAARSNSGKTICTMRKAHTRRGFTRSDGVKVASVRVKASRVCTKVVGGRNRQLGNGRYEILTDQGPEARFADREEAIREAARLGSRAMVLDTRSDRLVWSASRTSARRRERFDE